MRYRVLPSYAPGFWYIFDNISKHVYTATGVINYYTTEQDAEVACALLNLADE